MSYQVLARKWRPRSFRELVGQAHVLRALVNALDNDRLHHAFLFTGTRGVGKTTIARILAKSLNCEQGVSSTPCGECAACREIDEGRFVDLIEVDAASRTKVEDTRELLDNVQYAPTRGRYKVYLIDEVHMLSTHSFNALLKTLEEPPPHVKFLLATTDPQKLPVTILSRCLQFNLKRIPLEQIREHLGRILESEGIEAEAEAVTELARAADGSIRDALSLLDQAIAYGGGALHSTEVREMLGTIDRGRIHALLGCLAEADGGALSQELARLAEQSPDYPAVLAEVNTTLYRVAVAQTLPDAIDDSEGDREAVAALAERLAPEDVQLFYQIGLLGVRDLPLAPQPRAGFEMVLLRMFAFRPEGSGGSQTRPAPQREPAAPGSRGPERTAVAEPAPLPESTAPAAEEEPVPPAREAEVPPPVAEQAAAPAGADPLADWAGLVASLPIGGITRQLGLHSAVERFEAGALELLLDAAHGHLNQSKWIEGLSEALAAALGAPVRITIRVRGAEDAAETPMEQRTRHDEERQRAAQQAIEQDPHVQAILEHFDGRIEPDGVRPLG